MKKLIIIAIAAAAALAGCKSVSVSTPEWSAHYLSVGQSNDLKGLKVKAGENVALEIESTTSMIDPAVRDAMKTASAALAIAARACAACASGGVTEAAAAAVVGAGGACSE